MFRRRYQWLVGSFLLAAACALTLSCTQSNNSNQQTNIVNQQEITLEEATSVLNQTVQYVANQNLSGLCGMGGAVSMCHQLFENVGGWDTAPNQYPEIIDTYILQIKDCGNGNYITGGRVLVLKGIDGLGKPYQTDFFVFNNTETELLSAQYPVYWGNMSIGQTECSGSANVSSQN